ncbi:hypothetical protein [Rodentibacter myodis]|uniref:Uncharacterized protein n=1 Tax=Rodentibacter myodis TaxID=1907939 RepID=A0A1V3JTE9_9PAST|nr:hypothetical protein [Rodentibacter myodis]OOF60053.1 hypothetical protein BKL49_01350 [Rodentibacter myodis]
MILFFKLEGEYSLLSCLSKELKFYKKGVSKNKIYLYDNPRDEYKTKLYLIDGDHFFILDEFSYLEQKWYFINYRGKKEINMWIKADSVDLN